VASNINFDGGVSTKKKKTPYQEKIDAAKEQAMKGPQIYPQKPVQPKPKVTYQQPKVSDSIYAQQGIKPIQSPADYYKDDHLNIQSPKNGYVDDRPALVQQTPKERAVAAKQQAQSTGKTHTPTKNNFVGHTTNTTSTSSTTQSNPTVATSQVQTQSAGTTGTPFSLDAVRGANGDVPVEVLSALHDIALLKNQAETTTDPKERARLSQQADQIRQMLGDPNLGRDMNAKQFGEAFDVNYEPVTYKDGQVSVGDKVVYSQSTEGTSPSSGNQGQGQEQGQGSLGNNGGADIFAQQTNAKQKALESQIKYLTDQLTGQMNQMNQQFSQRKGDMEQSILDQFIASRQELANSGFLNSGAREGTVRSTQDSRAKALQRLMQQMENQRFGLNTEYGNQLSQLNQGIQNLPMEEMMAKQQASQQSQQDQLAYLKVMAPYLYQTMNNTADNETDLAKWFSQSGNNAADNETEVLKWFNQSANNFADNQTSQQNNLRNNQVRTEIAQMNNNARQVIAEMRATQQPDMSFGVEEYIDSLYEAASDPNLFGQVGNIDMIRNDISRKLSSGEMSSKEATDIWRIVQQLFPEIKKATDITQQSTNPIKEMPRDFDYLDMWRG
jgi:hypothetical protein